VSEHGVGSLIEGAPETPESRAEQRQRDRRGTRRVLIVLVSVVALVVGGALAYVGYLAYRVNDNITQEDFLPDDRPVATAPDGTEVALTGEGTNFLVMGADTRPGDAGRADVIVLVHVPEDASTIQMIHFPRDLYVEIPGRGKDKINAAYAYGREPLLVQTMENLLGVRIHHVARTDFEGFRNMTDAVGGVRVYAEEGGADGIVEGWNDLNGEQALAFVRERYTLSEGDISRGRRQLAFIKALFLEATSPENIANPLTVARFADAATENLVVDKGLSVRAMTDYAVSLRNVRGGDVVFATAPFSGYGTSPAGASIDIVDEEKMAELGEALRTDTMDTYLDVFVTP
jgi:polyisoprenyl-teichoic acid--peptidoglycan teichoic acid transferase